MKKLTWIDVALGTWLIVSPLALGYSLSRPLLVAENVLPGVFLIATSCWLLAMKMPSLQVTWLQALSGLWLVVGSFLLMFNHRAGAALNALLVGVAIVAVDLVEAWASMRQPGAEV